MKKLIFTGSAVAIITPFTDEGIDFPKLRELCEFHIANQTDAIVVAGTTGEASTMPDIEHISAVKFVVDTVCKRIPVIAGTGSNDTVHAVELARKAEATGADALLCVTPYYNKTSQKGLFLHFEAVAEAVTLPIIVYNVPSRTGMNINPETAYKLSAISNIVGIKECNLSQVPEIAHVCGDELAIYSGEDSHVLSLLALGGKGVISVMANIIPRETHQMVASFLSGDISTAISIQLKYVPLIKALFSDVSPIPVKEAMNILGYDVGSCRMPLCDMTEAGHDNLLQVLSQYDLQRGYKDE
ncbi:MAG: 4-hydroxy-tetrahydrodipicolinate synthase [Saccharofermentanales bacterium]